MRVVVLTVGFKIMGAGCASWVASVKRDHGLPCARHNWFLLTPMDLLQVQLSPSAKMVAPWRTHV